MFKVTIDEDIDEATGKPYYIMEDLGTGKCMFLDPDRSIENVMNSWIASKEYGYPSLYDMERECIDKGYPIKFGATLGTFDTVQDAYNAAKLNDLLE